MAAQTDDERCGGESRRAFLKAGAAAAAGAALTSDWLSAQTSSVRSSTVTELDEITLDTLRGTSATPNSPSGVWPTSTCLA